MGRIIAVIALLAAAAVGYFVWDLTRDDGNDAPLTPKPAAMDTEDTGGPPLTDQKPTKIEPVPFRPRVAPGPDLTDRDEQGEPEALIGRVTDTRGNPLAGATVQLLDLPFNQKKVSGTGRIEWDRAYDENILTETSCGEDGSFKFGDLTPNSKLYVRAQHPDYIPQIKDHVLVGLLVDFKLERGSRVEGVVTDKDSGAPVAGLRVRGWYKTPALFKSVKKSHRWKEDVLTDEEGKFAFLGVPPKTVKFLLYHADYEDLVEDKRVAKGKMNVINFQVTRGLVIKGRARNKMTGKPIKGAEVILRAILMPRFRARTDENGMFEFRGVERNKPAAVQVSARDYTTLSLNQQFTDADAFDEAKKNYLELLVDPAGKAAGTVFDPDGQPLPNAKVYVSAKNALTYTPRDFNAYVTDASGQFLVSDLNANAIYRILVITDGYIPGISDDISVGPDELREDVNVKVEAGSAIQGRIVNENGATVSDAVVTLAVPQYTDVWIPPGLGAGDKGTRQVVSEMDGRFTFDKLWTGNYTLSIEHPEHVPLTEEKLRFADTHSMLTKNYTLKIGRYIEGSVAGTGGAPAKGAIVRAYQPFTTTVVGQATVDETGLYRISALTTGKYRVQASKEGFTSRPKHDVPSDSSDANFRLVQSGTLVGAVVSSSGGRVPSYTVELYSEDQGTRHVKPTAAMGGRSQRFGDDRGGTFRLTEIDPGAYSVTITCETHMGFRRTNVEVGEGGETDLGVITLNAGASLSGTVMGASGEAVVGAQIMALNMTLQQELRQAARNPANPPKERDQSVLRNRKVQWAARTTGGGKYFLGGLPAGKYQFRITANRYATPEPEVIVVAKDTPVTRDFTLDQAGQVVLTIIDDFESPVSSVTASVFNTQRKRVSTGSRTPRSDGRGQMTIDNLPPGAYFVRLRRSGMISREISVEVRSAETTSMRVQLEHVKK